jgi:type II secretory pathway pseudopilin PulG
MLCSFCSTSFMKDLALSRFDHFFSSVAVLLSLLLSHKKNQKNKQQQQQTNNIAMTIQNCTNESKQFQEAAAAEAVAAVEQREKILLTSVPTSIQMTTFLETNRIHGRTHWQRADNSHHLGFKWRNNVTDFI